MGVAGMTAMQLGRGKRRTMDRTGFEFSLSPKERL
jgi:hypothetical protein